ALRTFSITIDIAAPADRVWQVMADVERWHEWTPSVIEVKRLDAGPLAVGSVAVIRQPKLPAALWKGTALEPNRGFTWINRSPGLRLVARHAAEPLGVGSRATLTLEMRGLFGGLFGRLSRSTTQKYLEWEARGLKARSEQPAWSHSGA